MDYNVMAYAVVGVFAAVYIIYRLLGQLAVRKLIRTEYEHVLNSEEHKVKGKFE